MKRGKGKVFVGLSGGVDSSVAAALLKQRGYDVVGVFIKVWQPEWITCTWPDERRDAMRAAAHIGIPFYTLDATDIYERGVIEQMVGAYERGETPNPDVLCNREVKFGALWEWARGHGADYIATGHYARIERHNGMAELRTSADAQKDQTYFLWTLTQDDLAHILFPIGTYTKSCVRALAEEFGLPTARKRDSQGLCFLGAISMREFLAHYVKLTPGDVYLASTSGNDKPIGVHDGALAYTLGQRQGIIYTNTPGMPLYVVARDLKRNTLTVAPHPPALATSDTLSLRSVSWVSGSAPDSSTLLARFRHRQALQSIEVIEAGAQKARIRCTEAGARPAAGQSAVLYSPDGTICLGGGVIEMVQ